MNARRQVAAGWLLWTATLAFATTVLLALRDGIDQVHAVLTLLLVVIGGSVSGGRVLGFTLAVVSFALIDFYFQPPYGLLSVGKPLDGVVLAAFLATAGVTTHLLTRARHEAEEARRRASEVESLSRLGAATLRYAEPEEALTAIVALVREAIDAAACRIYRWDAGAGLSGAEASAGSPTATSWSEQERRVASAVAATGRPMSLDEGDALVDHEGTWSSSDGSALEAQLLAMPLTAEQRTIGVLVVWGAPMLTLDPPRRRLLAALGYYAALGLERMRLVREAEHWESLREASRAKDQVLASISHDLRTPLTTIKALAQGAEERGDPAATAIVEQADRLARMVGDILELSRLRAGGLAVSPELNTAEDLLGAAVRQREGILGAQRVVTHVDFDAPALVGMFDFVHTLRIVGNLLDNALRFTPPSGVVDVWVTREGRELVFTVGDRGSGVGAAEQERIFEPFYRPADATPDTGHAGLGLSIARTLAELQGGTLEYAPRDGGGSLFILRLPAADLEEAGELEAR